MWNFTSPSGAYIGLVSPYAPTSGQQDAFSDLVVLVDDGSIPQPPLVTARRAVFQLPGSKGASDLRLAIYADPGYSQLEPDTVYGKVVTTYNMANNNTDAFVKIYVVEIVDVPAGSPYSAGDFIAVNEQRLFRERDGYAFVYHGAGWSSPEKDFVFNAVPV